MVAGAPDSRQTWHNMRRRCQDPKNKRYPHYGGRGIKVCPEWEDFAVFREWARASGYTDELQIERKEVDGDYCPENCCWIPKAQQQWNTQRSRHLIIFGETKPMTVWGRDSRCACPPKCFERRIRMGWDPERALTTPARAMHGPRGNVEVVSGHG